MMKNYKVKMRTIEGFRIKEMEAPSIEAAENHLLELLVCYSDTTRDQIKLCYITRTGSERKLRLRIHEKKITIEVKDNNLFMIDSK